MLRLSGDSMQKVRDRGEYPRMTLPICWERVSGSVTQSCITNDAGAVDKLSYSPMRRSGPQLEFWLSRVAQNTRLLTSCDHQDVECMSFTC